MGRLIYKFLYKFNFLRFFNLESTVILNDRKFIVPILGNVGISNLFVSERWMISLLKQVLPLKKGTFLDVGVNIGQTMLKLRSVDSEIPYFGFEPNPFCIHYSNKLIELNQFQSSTLFPFGVSNTTEVGVLNFYTDKDSDTSASMISNFRPDEKVKKQVFIPLYNDKNFVELIGDDSIGFLKVDVEGAELEVIESFQGIIQKHQPIILIEILPVYTPDNTERLSRQEKMEAIFKSQEYAIFKLEKTKDQVTGVQLMETIGIHSDVMNCDYICVPQPLKEAVANLQFT